MDALGPKDLEKLRLEVATDLFLGVENGEDYAIARCRTVARARKLKNLDLEDVLENRWRYKVVWRVGYESAYFEWQSGGGKTCYGLLVDDDRGMECISNVNDLRGHIDRWADVFVVLSEFMQHDFARHIVEAWTDKSMM